MLMRCCWQNRLFVAPKLDRLGTIGDRIYGRHLSMTSGLRKNKEANRREMTKTNIKIESFCRERSVARKDKTSSPNNGTFFFEELPARLGRETE